MRLLVYLTCVSFGLFGLFELRRDIPAGSDEPGLASGWSLPSLGVSSLTSPALAASRAKWPGPFPVDILKVLDGDTVEVEFRDGPCGRGPCAGSVLKVRVRDVDAPEAHRCSARTIAASGGRNCAACDAEFKLGREALAFMRAHAKPGDAARVSQISPDKYAGRVVAALEVFRGGEWVSLGPMLIERNLAVPYFGGRKTKPWCAEEKDQ